MSAAEATTKEALRHAIATAAGSRMLVVTGAGVSLASGLPTFRGTDEGAVWAATVVERGTRRFFAKHPDESWRWYLGRFDKLVGVEPNAAHRALAALEAEHTRAGGEFLLVTQNVDMLHRAAGSQALVHVHGVADRVRCVKPSCEHSAPRGSLPFRPSDFDAFREAPTVENIPRCPACDSLLRPHILWFDERYDEHRDYEIARVLGYVKRARVVVFAGTSFSVGVTEAILSTARQRSAAIFSIDPAGMSPSARVGVIAEPAETVFPWLVGTP